MTSLPSAPEATTLTALSKRHSSMVSVLRGNLIMIFLGVAFGLTQDDHILPCGAGIALQFFLLVYSNLQGWESDHNPNALHRSV